MATTITHTNCHDYISSTREIDMKKVENGYKSEGFVYNYAIWDRTSLNFMFADNPDIYAQTLEEAFKTAASMFEEGCVKQIEIGMNQNKREII